MSEKKSKQRQGGCLSVLAFPLIGVGVFMLGLIAWTLSDWWRMQGWVEVAAQVLEARLEEHHDDDGTTYRAVARYTYDYNGRQYEGDRVAIDTAADNLGNYHQRKVTELKRHLSRNEPVRCFVDAASPERSVLYRELRFEKLAFFLLFALVFGGAGVGMSAYGLYARRQERSADALEQQYPDQPWMWREDWAAGKVRSSTKLNMMLAVSFAVMWNLISSPILFFLPAEVRKSNYLALIGLLFPIVGLGLAIWAVIAVRRFVKYGESTFQMASVPGVVGGPLAGVVHTTVNLRPESGFRQTLTCLRKVTTGSGKNRSTREHVLWQTTKIMQRELAEVDATKSAIPVQFHIPYEAEPTTVPAGESPVSWRLEVVADAPGVDYYAAFDLPVFRTTNSSPDYQPDDSAIAPYVREETIADVYRECRVYRRATASGLQIEFPLFRNLGPAFGLTVFLVIWSGAIALMIHLGAPLLFPVVFGLLELLLVYFALELWLWRSVMEVTWQAVSLRAGLLGLARTRNFTKDQLENITFKSGMQSGQKLYYDLQLITTDGKTHRFGKSVPSQSAARAIVNDIKQVLGIDGPADQTFADSDQRLDRPRLSGTV